MSGVSQLLSTSEAAAKYGVSTKTILRWVAKGKLAAVQLPSGRIRIPEDAVVFEEVVPDETPDEVAS